jgi:DNA-directed RNA polymerase specialized sigma24 family protein
MPTRKRPLTDSPFDTLERTFTLLTSGPDPLALDGTAVPGLPDRPIPLGELKARLLHPSTRFEVRDAIVDELVTRAQAEGGRWTVGLAGVLLPGLRRTVRALVRACPGKADDIEAEALAAFLAAVSRCQPGRPRLASWLRWQARKGATRLLHAEMAERARPGTEPVSAAPPRPWGHPDLVLAKAVRAGVISAADAELISATRIGEVDLAEAADHLDLGYWACHKRRRRAESRIRDWVTGDDYPPFDDVQKTGESGCSVSGDCRRPVRSMDRRPGKRRSSPPPRR